jgi:hypothetical protein
MKNRIFTAIEFKGENLMSLAELWVKCRRCLYPFAIQVKLGKTMVDKKIRSEKLDELFGGKVIANVGKTDS